MDLKERGLEDMNMINLAQNMDQWRPAVKTTTRIGVT
jgi:hypothetical protein